VSGKERPQVRSFERDGRLSGRAAPGGAGPAVTDDHLHVPAAAAGGLLRTWPAQVAAAAAGLALALVLTQLLRPWLSHTQFLFFHAAVVLAAAVGGMRLAVPAIIATLLLVEFAIIDGAGVPALTQDLLVRDAMVAVVAFGLALLVSGLQRARAMAAAKATESRLLAESLREQAAELEVQVADSEAMAAELEDLNRVLELQTDSAQRGAQRAERVQRLTALLLETVGETGVGAVMVREARDCVEADAAALATTDGDGAVVLAASAGLPDDFTLSDNGPTPLTDAMHTGEAVWVETRAELEHRYARFAASVAFRAVTALPLSAEDRRVGAILFGFRTAGDFVPEDRSFMQLIAHEGAQALERARLHQMSMRARVRAEFAERRLAFLAEASARLAASFDYRMTLASLAELCAPELADWCIVHLLGDNGARQLVAITHADTELVAACRSLEERRPGACILVEDANVRAATAPIHVATVDDELLRRAAPDDDIGELRRLGFRSQVVTPIVVEDGVNGTITFVHGDSGRSFSEADIRLATELGKRAGQAVENARLYQAAQFASEAKSDFLAVISHELRTPLNAIIGYTDLLLLGIPAEMPQQTRRQVERIRSASDGLLHLVEEVLSFSRIEAGKEELRISPVDASALLRECAALVEAMAAQKSLTLTLDVPEEPIKLVSDERKIRQIITNLLSNAIKFTEQGTIVVSARRDDREVCLAVEDTGIGIPAQHLERIFDPFWQVEQSATRRFGGTGLGLGVARKLARLLEGRLEVKSEVGKGSRFTLALPLRVPGLERRA
jgi:signal transduction histidine kinase